MARIIALVGGGTMGPTAPLLAVQKLLAKRHPKDKFIWAGTPEGPERGPVEAQGVKFVSIPAAKVPRYLSLTLLRFPLDYYHAYQAAKNFVNTNKPDLIIGAGGYTQVPLINYAAKQGIPCIIHQLDFKPLLSNIAVAKKVKLITNTFVYYRKQFRSRTPEKAIATPNRFAQAVVPERSKAIEFFSLSPDRPVVLFIGGGTGSRALNDVLENNLKIWLKKTQIIQVTGKGRSAGCAEESGYLRFEFLDEWQLLNAISAADVVISRAGMGSITDLAALSKAAILVPIPGSAQEKNTRHLPLATIEVKEGPDLFKHLFSVLCELLNNPKERSRLGYELHKTIKTDDGTELANLAESFLPEELD